MAHPFDIRDHGCALRGPKMIEDFKDRLRELTGGVGCQVLSKGDDCRCVLCDLDRLLVAARTFRPQRPEMKKSRFLNDPVKRLIVGKVQTAMQELTTSASMEVCQAMQNVSLAPSASRLATTIKLYDREHMEWREFRIRVEEAR